MIDSRNHAPLRDRSEPRSNGTAIPDYLDGRIETLSDVEKAQRDAAIAALRAKLRP